MVGACLTELRQLNCIGQKLEHTLLLCWHILIYAKSMQTEFRRECKAEMHPYLPYLLTVETAAVVESKRTCCQGNLIPLTSLESIRGVSGCVND